MYKIKRVPLDFEAQIGTPWKGSERPQCSECCNSEETSSLAFVNSILNLLVFCANHHTGSALPLAFREYTPYLPENIPLSPDLKTLLERLRGQPLDANAQHASVGEIRQTLLKAAGLPDTWGECPACAQGTKRRAELDSWVPEEPPTGNGWQYWSKDTPMTPVFATPEELAKYLENQGHWLGLTTFWQPSGWWLRRIIRRDPQRRVPGNNATVLSYGMDSLITPSPTRVEPL